ncbi:LysR family transcriptional regulator [Endozoicomonas sp. G2_1]|uniref:LysR family transcriptional regulator n=1 Tax=Endozoicomonas sp. G2_1 TaxID=2821091 RepID=UPI0032AF6AA9
MLAKNNINLADVRTFVVLAQAGSFTKAAEVLGCSRSHISKQLAQLEAELGVSLLVRTTRSQHLTQQGLRLFEQCQQSLHTINSAVEEAVGSAERAAGEIRINCVGGAIGEDIVAPLVTDFMARYPDINVELDFASRRVDLVAGEFDFVFRMGALQDSSLIARKLTDLTINTYASPQYLTQFGRPTAPKELTEHRCISGSLRQWRFIDKQTGSEQDCVISSVLTCKNGRVMLSAALAGQGIIRVPELYCREHVEQGLLEPVFEDWQVASTPFYLVYLQDNYQPARLKLFKEFVVSEFSRYLI